LKRIILSLFKPLKLFKLLRTRIAIGIILGAGLVLLGHNANKFSSTDSFCESCHVHPHATESWRLSTHSDNPSGITVHCVECHLPAGGVRYFSEKIRLGAQDIYGKLFKDPAEIDWDQKSQLEHAATFTFKDACLRCHQNLFPLGLSPEGDEAHLHYSRYPDRLRCINCHLHVGHFSEEAETVAAFGRQAADAGEIYTGPAEVERFEDFTETIPGSRVRFDMVAIPGGTFTIGSPGSEPYRNDDEGPAGTVTVSGFWMGRTEVSWNEFEAFYRQTASEGRTDARILSQDRDADVDAITGATAPYGNPDQGWGKGSRPAITMTHHAAVTYCQWLSRVTGKTYRLPTEAEWEYACRGGTQSAYFFEGNPKSFAADRFWNRLFGADTEPIGSYVVYDANSQAKTQAPSAVEPNPFGLLNMAGNVREFCLDWYVPVAYARYSAGGGVVDPTGPAQGKEHVVRGGSFKSGAPAVRSAARDRTRTGAWLLTDPQFPKSIWWYSDCNDVGFRVVCEYEKTDTIDG